MNLPAPATAANAVQYNLPSTLAPVSTAVVDAPQLASLEVTESSQMLIELRNPDTRKSTYITENVTVNGNVYTVNSSRAQGTVKVKVAQTRATEASTLEIDLKVKLETGDVVEYKTGETGVLANKAVTTGTSGDATVRLARTWNILGATLDLVDLGKNESYYMEFTSKNNVFDLNDVLIEAKKRNVSFTEEEEKELNRKITSLTITSSGNLILVYDSGKDDVASWAWADSEKTTFTIKLKDGSDGNKFINDDTRMETAFSDNRCNLRMKIRFNDGSNKNWDASLMLKLQSR